MGWIHDGIQALVGFIQTHAAWAAPIAFALTFLKALAFVAMVVPSITLMLAIGTLVGASGIGFLDVWIAASLGAALGDWVSYAIGRYFKDRARTMWPLGQRPELLARAERFFHRWGVMSVVLCRFFSPLRATVPLFCGIFGMAFLPFQIANVLSALLWAALLLAPGSIFGHWIG